MSTDNNLTATSVESALMALLLLEQKARNAKGIASLQFMMLNQTRTLVSYDQAILWDTQKMAIAGASGVPDVDGHAPLTQWLNSLCSELAKSRDAHEIHRLPTHEWSAYDRQMVSEHVSGVFIWFPIKDGDGRLVSVMLLSRTDPLSLREKKLMGFLGEAYGHAWYAQRHLEKTKKIRLPGKRKVWLATCVILAGLMFVPVRQSVLAPSEIVSAVSVVVRMPMNGVVKSLQVTPNSYVKKGQLLATLDARQLNEQLAQARQRLVIAKAELRLARQQSFYDASRKASIRVLEGREKLAQSQVNFLQQKVSQTDIFAPQDGIALFDDQGDWVGRPLNLGSPVMMVADPKQTQLEIRLSVEDMMELKPGNEVRFFPNSRPTEPVSAKVKTIAYHSTLQNDGQYAYVLKGTFTGNAQTPQMGLKGVAKLYGRKTALFFYLLRRPVSHLRLWWGAL